MVNTLSQTDRAAVSEAIAKTAAITNAKIDVAVAPSSGHYRDYIMFYGFVLGSIAGLVMWFAHIGDLPLMLATQIGVIVLVDFLPPLKKICICLVPRRIKNHHAEEAAYLHYLAAHNAMPENTPFVLLYVSLAERYVHVITNPTVHDKIPDAWDAVTNRFTTAMRAEGLIAACSGAVAAIAAILAPKFPRS